MAEPLAAMTTRWIARARGPECLQIFITGASGHQGFPYNTPSSQQERPSSVACFRHGSNSFHALQTRPRGGAEGAASPQTLRQKDCCGANALEREPGPVLHRTASRMPSGPSPGPGHDIHVVAAKGSVRWQAGRHGPGLRRRVRSQAQIQRGRVFPAGTQCRHGAIHVTVSWRSATGSGQQRAMARCDRFWPAAGDGAVRPVLADTGRWRSAAGSGRYRPCPCKALLICGVAARLPPFRSLHSLSLETLPWHKYPAI